MLTLKQNTMESTIVKQKEQEQTGYSIPGKLFDKEF